MLVGATGSNAFLLLALLACPVGMGLMMFFMSRGIGMGRHNPRSDAAGIDGGRPLAELKAMQARLAEKIDALEAQHKPQEPAKTRSNS